MCLFGRYDSGGVEGGIGEAHCVGESWGGSGWWRCLDVCCWPRRGIGSATYRLDNHLALTRIHEGADLCGPSRRHQLLAIKLCRGAAVQGGGWVWGVKPSFANSHKQKLSSASYRISKIENHWAHTTQEYCRYGGVGRGDVQGGATTKGGWYQVQHRHGKRHTALRPRLRGLTGRGPTRWLRASATSQLDTGGKAPS